MKVTFVAIAMLACCCVFSSFAQDPEAVPAEKQKPAIKQIGTLSEEEIGKLVAEYTDEKSGKSYKMEVYFAPKTRLSESQKKALKRPGAKFPYSLFAYVYEVKTNGNKSTLSRVDDGSFEFYIQDEAGRLVQNYKKIGYTKLCQS